jgi:hypothetical protein
MSPGNAVPLPPRRPPELNSAQAKPAAPAINSAQINTGETNILDEIGGFLSDLFAGSMGGQAQAPGGYVWDSLQGWVPGQAQAAPAAVAAPAAPTAPTAPKAPEPWHAPMAGAPAYSGPAIEPQNEPLPNSMGQLPRTVVPSMEFNKGGPTTPPGNGVFSK